MEIYHKDRVHGSDHAVKLITQKCHNFNFSYLHKKPESGLIFKNLSSCRANSIHEPKFNLYPSFAYKTPGKSNSRTNIH